ncbi:MAG: DUF3160 domain-containing protein [Candidatus Hermodarchaeota archaeon]
MALDDRTNVKIPSKSKNILYTISKDTETAFGIYEPIKASLLPVGPDIKYKKDLSDVQGIELIKDLKTREILSKNGFVVLPAKIKKFYDLYTENEDYHIAPHFITIDVVLWAFHQLFEKTLMDIEINFLYENLCTITEQMLSWALQSYNTIKSMNLKNAFRQVLAYFTVAAQLLELKIEINSDVRKLVNQELMNIRDKIADVKSTITDNDTDFTQFIVRGHYTRSKTLATYFLTMMFYGRMKFYLERTPQESRFSVIEQTRMALLITIGVKLNKQVNTAWRKLNQITSFLIGRSDDLGVLEYLNLLHEHTIDDLESDVVIEEVIKQAKKLPEPKILGELDKRLEEEKWASRDKGFLFMGQKFIPDGYFFQNLIHPKIESRFLASGLDIMAILGSNRALTHLKDEISKYGEYLAQLEKMQQETKSWDTQIWTQSIYFLWLYSLLPLLHDKEQQYPSYMRTDAWRDKELNTCLGSWAELRHDTILYAKQAYTTLGDGSSPLADSVVEANPELLGRIISLLTLMTNYLNTQKISFPAELAEFSAVLTSLKSIAEKQLRGELIPPASYYPRYNEWEVLCSFGKNLKYIIERASYVKSEIDELNAIIADVITDSQHGKVLEVGTGYINEIYVIAYNRNNQPCLTRGAIYSYYEFAWTMRNRLTDEEWWKMLKGGNEPKRPSWTNSFI